MAPKAHRMTIAKFQARESIYTIALCCSSWSLPTNAIEAGLSALFVVSAFSNLPKAISLEGDGAEAGQNWRRQFFRQVLPFQDPLPGSSLSLFC